MSESPLVDVDWLAAHLDDPNLVLLDASISRSVAADGSTEFAPGHAAFAAGHLPGARFADLYDGFSDPEAPYLFTRPTLTQLDAALRTAGVDSASSIVVYDQLSGAYAARVWLVLRSFGITARVLDGGMAAWDAAGHRVETGDAHPTTSAPQSSLQLVDDPAVFVDLASVRTLSARLVAADQTAPALVCALRVAEFVGDPERERSGHIPGSLSLPYPAVLDASGRIEAAAVRAHAVALGLDQRGAVAYCGGGVNAAGLALAMVYADLPAPQVYDGSLNEWRTHPDLPLTLGTGGPDQSERQDSPVQGDLG